MGLNIPAFFGIYNAHRAIVANQNAINVVNNNIANANTPGYSRQRVDMSPAGSFPPATISNYVASGVTGQGVNVTDITRSHDNFLDAQMRSQQNQLGYNEAAQDYLQRIEDVSGNLQGSNINDALNKFFEASQALSRKADDVPSRSTFMQSAKNVMDLFKQQASMLKDLRTSIVGDASKPSTLTTSEAYLTVNDINQSLSEVANLNEKIIGISAAGASPNDLMDRRDVVLEKIAKNLNVTIEYLPSNQIAIKLGANKLVEGNTVSNTLNLVTNTGVTPTPTDVPALVQLSSNAATVNADITTGKLGGLLKMGGNDTDTTTIRGMLETLDNAFGAIATEVNALQASGFNMNGVAPTATVDDQIFIPPPVINDLAIFDYSINATILKDVKLIAAADATGPFAGVGDGRNAAKIAALQNKSLAGLGNISTQEYMNNKISNLGLNSKNAQDRTEQLNGVIQQIDGRRQSLQGVNIEEEMLDLMRYQRGFEASSRVIKALDEVMKNLLNLI
jgi:flagellar hook-associated protein 1